MYYDSHSQEPYVSTFKEMADIWGYSKNAVFASITTLLVNNLICKIGKEGRRTKYIPNVPELQKILKEYLSSVQA